MPGFERRLSRPSLAVAYGAFGIGPAPAGAVSPAVNFNGQRIGALAYTACGASVAK